MQDCDLPACVADTCGGETILCTRTCTNGEFGTDDACASNQETKTDICPAVPCSESIVKYPIFTLL